MKVELKLVCTFEDGSELVLPMHTKDFLESVLSHTTTRRLAVIKFLRAQFGLTLENAKDLVDWIGSQPCSHTPSNTLGQLLRDKLDAGRGI